MSGTNIHLQDQFLETFFSSPFASDFYLTGGTALARFYLHHRDSIDLDLFTENKNVDFKAIAQQIPLLVDSFNLKIDKQIVVDTFLSFIFSSPDKSFLKVDFVKEVPVHFGGIELHDKVRVDSLENIATNKLLTVFGRIEPKDFIDLYFILQSGKFNLESLIANAKQKDLGLTEFYLANSLANVSALENYPEVFLPFDKAEFIKFYQTLSRDLFLKIKPRE